MIRLKTTHKNQKGAAVPLRFFRRVPLGKGLTMNLSKTGASLSLGPSGGAVTLGTSGARGTVSLPGTGLFYTVEKRNLFSGSKKRRARDSSDDPDQNAKGFIPPSSPLELGFFDKLLVPKEEQTVVEGFKALITGDDATALDFFEQASKTADARWIAGMMRLKKRDHHRAEAHLNFALENEQDLGVLVGKYQVEVILNLPITQELSAHVKPRRRGTLLALAESYQDRGAWQKAEACLRTLIKEHPEDPVVKLSLVELLSDQNETMSQETAKTLVVLIGEVENLSDVHATLLLYKAKALETLSLLKAALAALTAAHRRKKDRDPELLRRIRYERALIYEKLGRKARARGEFEALYAQDPAFEDVAKRLGLS